MLCQSSSLIWRSAAIKCEISQSMMPLRAELCLPSSAPKQRWTLSNQSKTWQNVKRWKGVKLYCIIWYCLLLKILLQIGEKLSFRRCCSRPLWTRMKVAVRRWLRCPSTILLSSHAGFIAKWHLDQNHLIQYILHVHVNVYVRETKQTTKKKKKIKVAKLGRPQSNTTMHKIRRSLCAAPLSQGAPGHGSISAALSSE